MIQCGDCWWSMMDDHAKAVYRFGPFRYDADAGLLFRGDELVPLQPKVAETLQALLENRGRLVEKAYLMRRLWPDTSVEEIGLARNISLLRKALGEKNESSTYVETLSKRGYRFVAEVHESQPVEEPAPALQPTASRRLARYRRPFLIAMALLGMGVLIDWQFYRPSTYLPQAGGFAGIAVLPYECLSPELGCGAFTHGLNDALLADLSKLEKIHVTSPATVLRYQRARLSPGFMARVLGLEVLLEGTLQRAGDNVRITSRLVDVHSGMLIWSESYEYPATQSSQAQVDAARLISAQVGAHLAIHHRGVSRNR